MTHPPPQRRPWIVPTTLRLLVPGLLLPLAIFVLRGRSLWYDEAALGVNIVTRPLAGLLQPLDHLQVAPIGYLLVAKVSGALLGYSDVAIRLPSIAAYLCLFGLLARRAGRAPESLLRFVMIVAAPGVIRYAFELKPYVCGVLLMVVLIEYGEAVFARAGAALLGSAAAVLFTDAAFIQVPLFAALAGLRQVASHAAPPRTVALRLLATAVPLALYYVAFVAGHPEHGRMSELWSRNFLFAPGAEPPAAFLAQRLGGIVRLGYIMPGFQALWIFYFMGLYGYWRERRLRALAAATLPILAHLAFSALRLYPFDGGRLTLYLLVPIAAAAADGFGPAVAALARCPAARRYRLRGVAWIATLAAIAGNGTAYALLGGDKEHIRPILADLQRRPRSYQESVPLHFLPMSDRQLEYYEAQARAAGRPLLEGYQTISHDDDWEPFLRDALTRERVVAVFSHSRALFGARPTRARVLDAVTQQLRSRDPGDELGLRVRRFVWMNGAGLVEVEAARPPR